MFIRLATDNEREKSDGVSKSSKVVARLLVTKFRDKYFSQVAAIAPWFHLGIPSCGPGFESQAHHLCFFEFVLKL